MAVTIGNYEILRSAVRMIDEQRHRERERVRRAVGAASLPLAPDVLEALCQLNPSHARDALRQHPGFSLWEKRKSYETSFRVFERSVLDLVRVSQEFMELAIDESIFDRPREAELNEIVCKSQKELFATTNAAQALVEQSRRLRSSVNVPKYNEERQQCFGNDGLHEFVIGLRRILQHIQVVQLNWQVEERFDPAGRKATFRLDRDEVSLVVADPDNRFTKIQRERIGHYLGAAPEKIEPRHVFIEYLRRAREFHTWFSTETDAAASEELRDYERCSRAIANAGTRRWWKLMLGTWLNSEIPPNPYNYLHHYLTPAQAEEVYRVPMGSSEQIDKVIKFMDPDGACDDDLRQLAYDLFRRANH